MKTTNKLEVLKKDFKKVSISIETSDFRQFETIEILLSFFESKHGNCEEQQNLKILWLEKQISFEKIKQKMYQDSNCPVLKSEKTLIIDLYNSKN